MQFGETEVQALREIIRERFGLVYDDANHAMFAQRIQGRLSEVGASGYLEYADYLRSHPRGEGEFDELASALTNNETYFFRERAQFDALCGAVFDDLSRRVYARNANRLRFWSAACSTGEEPYSLAMALLDSGRTRDEQISIHATDVSRRALAHAQRGAFRDISFRSIDLALLQRYFRAAGTEFEIVDRVKNLVTFSHLNLMDGPAVERFGVFDAIFCRNVLIYFDRATQKRVVESLAGALRPQGYLFLGHSESLFRLTDLFEPLLFPNAVVYRLRKGVRDGARSAPSTAALSE